MLRFPSDRLYVGIESERIAFVRMSGMVRDKIVDHHAIDLGPGKAAADLVVAIKAELSSPRWRRTAAHLTLADNLLRYFVAERPRGVRSATEISAAAQLRFEDLYGEAATSWTIRVDARPFSHLQLACALSNDLQNGLVRAFSESRIPLRTLRPFSLVELDNFSGRRPRGLGQFATINRHGLLIACVRDRDWLEVQWQPMRSDSAAEVRRILNQARLRNGMEVGNSVPTEIYGMLENPALCSALQAYPARLFPEPNWPDQSEDWSSVYRIALSPRWPRCM